MGSKRQDMTKKLALFVIKLCICLGLLYLALQSSGILTKEGFSQAKQTIKDANLFYLAISVVFILIMDITSTIKWKALTSFKAIPISFARLLVFYIVGRFYNLILPSSIGGDVIRIHLLGKHTGNPAEAAAIVFVERFTGVIMLVLLASAAIMVAGLGNNESQLIVAVGVGVVGIVGIYWIIMDKRPLALLSRLTENFKLSFLEKVLAKARKLQTNIYTISSSNKALAISFALSGLFYFASMLNVWVTVLVFQEDVSLWSMVIAVPIIMFIMNIPVSIGNIGIMEFGYTMILMQFGVSGDVAIATALLMRLKLLLAGGIGGIFHLFLGNKKISEEEIDSMPSRQI